MTDRKRKDFYLQRIRRILTSKLITSIMRFHPKLILEKLEEELKIVAWNNSKEWTDEFIKDEVEPLLKRHGINIERH